MKYSKGSLVRVYENKVLVDKFPLHTEMPCITSVRKMVYRLYPHLDHSKVEISVGV